MSISRRAAATILLLPFGTYILVGDALRSYIAALLSQALFLAVELGVGRGFRFGRLHTELVVDSASSSFSIPPLHTNAMEAGHCGH